MVEVEMVKRKTIYGFYGHDDQTFLKITLALPKFVSKARGILESGAFGFRGFPSVALAPFESNIAYELRFMIDCKVYILKHMNIILSVQRRNYLTIIFNT